MFHTLHFNGQSLHCVNFNGKWFFLLAQLCNILSINEHYDYLLDSLTDYSKAIKTRRNQLHICTNVEQIVAFIEKNSHKAKIVTAGGEKTLVNTDAAQFRQHCSKFAPHTVAIDLLFFCEYLRTMYQRWEQRRVALDLSLSEFYAYLRERLKCPCWAFFLQNLSCLEPFAEHYLHGRPPKQSFTDATDDLLQYLDSFRDANTRIALSSPHVLSAELHDVDLSETTKRSNVRKKRRLTKQDQIAIAADQEWRCFWCRETLNARFETDHIERFCETGNDHHSNLWALCSNCHAKKTELDRRRQRPAVWSNYRPLTAAQQELRRREIISKITDV